MQELLNKLYKKKQAMTLNGPKNTAVQAGQSSTHLRVLKTKSKNAEYYKWYVRFWCRQAVEFTRGKKGKEAGNDVVAPFLVGVLSVFRQMFTMFQSLP